MRTHGAVVLAGLVLGGVVLTMAIRPWSPPSPFWTWFGVATALGLALNRPAALWLAPVPSIVVLAEALWRAGGGASGGNPPLIVAWLVGGLAFVGLWGIALGLRCRALLAR